VFVEYHKKTRSDQLKDKVFREVYLFTCSGVSSGCKRTVYYKVNNTCFEKDNDYGDHSAMMIN